MNSLGSQPAKAGNERTSDMPTHAAEHAGHRINQMDTDRLRQDLQRVIDDVEQVLQSLAGATGEQASELRSQAARKLHDARERLARMEHDALARVRVAGKRTEDAVKQHPWIAIGGVSAAAFLLGMLSRTRH